MSGNCCTQAVEIEEVKSLRAYDGKGTYGVEKKEMKKPDLNPDF